MNDDYDDDSVDYLAQYKKALEKKIDKALMKGYEGAVPEFEVHKRLVKSVMKALKEEGLVG